MLKTKIFTCEKGDVILNEGRRKMIVSSTVIKGKEDRLSKKGEFVAGNRSEITACRIMPDNGQILYRSPIYIGVNWIHYKGE